MFDTFRRLEYYRDVSHFRMMAGLSNEESAIKMSEAFDLAHSQGFYEIECWQDCEIIPVNHKVGRVDNNLSKKLCELAAASHRSEKTAFTSIKQNIFY